MQMAFFLAKATALSMRPPLQADSVVSQSRNCCSLKDTRLPVLMAHAGFGLRASALGFKLWPLRPRPFGPSALRPFGPSAHWPRASAFGLRPSAFGLWPLAFGLWPLAFGLWPLAFGLWSVCTHPPCRAHISLTHFHCVTYRHRVHAWLKVFAVRMSLHLTLSILMFHPPSLLFPDGHFETTFPTSTSSTSLPNCSRPESAGQAHFRSSGEEFGYLDDPTHSTGHKLKESDKITSVDGDTKPINVRNHDSICNFLKITRENAEQFGVPLMFETTVSHVSYGEFALQRQIQESMPR